MLSAVENLRLGELYQGLTPPATAAQAPREAASAVMRDLQLSIMLLSGGKRRTPSYPPFGGSSRVIVEIPGGLSSD
jgi:hypothetical protein